MGILAIDFGGTRLRTGWFEGADLDLIQRTETRTRVEDGQTAVIERIIATAQAVIPQDAIIEAIGIAAPGPLDAAADVIQHAKTLPGWHHVPLAQIVSEAFGGVPSFMQNDANLAAVAEYHRGAGRGCDPMIYLTLSTGIGGGAIIRGDLFTGSAGLAIEPGHQMFRLPDGQVKRLEELASGTAIGKRAQALLQTTDEPSILRTYPEVDGRVVGQAAQAGDPLALQIVSEAGEWLGLGLVNLLHLFNPQAVVVGGSVAGLGDLLFTPARAMIQAHVLDNAFIVPDLIRPAALGEDVCLIGAAWYAAGKVTL
ncbi:MAG: ROK family protein [Anaerolineae bacterium]|nr:ROK family protein [Anaerolineae bacterium]